MRSATFAAVMVTGPPSATRSTAKSPLSRWPRIVRVSPFSSTRTKGPIGSDNVWRLPPILNCSSTA